MLGIHVRDCREAERAALSKVTQLEMQVELEEGCIQERSKWLFFSPRLHLYFFS